MAHLEVLFNRQTEGDEIIYEDVLVYEHVRERISKELRTSGPELGDWTNYLVVKGWQEGKYYPYPLLFKTHGYRQAAAIMYQEEYGGDLPYVPSDMEVRDRISDIEDYLLMME